jgi:CheY-like chemotaxis protein
MDGATFLEQLAQHPLPRRPQCVVLTGLVSRHLQHLLGGYPVLFKPYRAEQLLELVASVLAAR